ncbi:MAG: zf-HC2 domain-containing protein [Cyclobacteriaceae bacterium]|nr:MAG: zf-HC2 domain-containing protein [Cyclobacteriaceae bacterium]
MNCEEYEKLLMRFGQLTNREEEELRAHAAGCPACAKVLEFIELEQRWIKRLCPQNRCMQRH